MGRLGYASPNDNFMRSYTDKSKRSMPIGYADDDAHGFYMNPDARRPDVPVNKKGPIDIAPTQPNFRSGNRQAMALPAPQENR